MNNEELKKLKNILANILVTAPSEEKCTDEENELYADMQNLQESITEYLEKNIMEAK